MGASILSATYRTEEVEKEIYLEDMTHELYETVYKHNLFCPFSPCPARMVFVAGNVRPSHFRKLQGEKHDSNCLFDLEEKLSTKGRSVGKGVLTSISQKHVKSVLKSAHDILDEKPKRTPGTKSKPPKPPVIYEVDPGKEPPGVATLRGPSEEEGIVEGNGREPNVYKRFVDNLTDQDVKATLCVMGEITHIDLQMEHANFTISRNGVSAKIVFEEAFVVNNPNDFTRFWYLKRYLDDNPRAKCGCVGEIRKSKDGTYFEIVPFNYYEFSFERKNINDIAIAYIRNDIERKSTRNRNNDE
ncbi:hypothetical protein P4H65_12230 [Paenibacillus chitinolyticus]|uniref:hypothetical protein n=1 Tax=Paenibacillus chitinolyticus TaxID=79263 RepID=UPI002DBEAE26|nr:hypothetical protein [Paenibacillus chitinolyticus]MEC0246556.1 hypothetical protein [Paenibacillus chitinolyticus]